MPEASQTQTPCPYNADELNVLGKFGRVCEEIENCRFIRDLPKHDHSFKITKQADGSCLSSYPNYDKDDFLAFLTHFRKLVAQGESTNIFKVMNVIGKYANEDERKALKLIRQNLVAAATNPALKIAIGTPGNETEYTPEQLENIFFNAQVFHTDDSLQEDLRKVQDYDPITKMSFLSYATFVASQANQIAGVLEQRGYLQ